MGAALAAVQDVPASASALVYSAPDPAVVDRVAAGDGPTLTELLAAVLATMRELLIVERSNAKGIDEILSRLDTMPVTGRISSSPRTNGAHG